MNQSHFLCFISSQLRHLRLVQLTGADAITVFDLLRIVMGHLRRLHGSTSPLKIKKKWSLAMN